ncbi:PREDICTED: S-locus-specific glycoprotein S6-like, partial [Prunus mume]|uniref:S-locus-specific glycoprotein S6-like n=1 Tax=Prunus mume TaxID=102107 RepID=A0ABM1LJV9_PRUMU
LSPPVKSLSWVSSSQAIFQAGTWACIWYKNVQNSTVVWVANRDTPLSNPSGALLMTGEHGNIVLLDPSGNVTWSSNHTQVLRPNVLLLDIGNLVIKEGTENSPTFFWQSFDYPTHILLPDMKLGWKLSTGLNRYLTSWKSSEDPSTGDFSIKLDHHGFPEIFLWDKHVKNFRTGPWNGMIFSGVPENVCFKAWCQFQLRYETR